MKEILDEQRMAHVAFSIRWALYRKKKNTLKKAENIEIF